MHKAFLIPPVAAMLWWGGGNLAAAGAEKPVWRGQSTPLLPVARAASVKPELLSGTASYRFGWMRVSAATALLTFTPEGRNIARLDFTATTVGTVRRLWPMDATAYAVADAATLLPIRSRQAEWYRNRTVISATEFLPNLVYHGKGRISGTGLPDGFSDNKPRNREEISAFIGGKVKRLKGTGLLDMHTALLRIRLHPLNTGDTITWVIYHDNYPYLARVEVLGREPVRLRSGAVFSAIKLRLDLQWIDRDGQLNEHKRFRGACGWLSDDARRLPLKIESEVFVGSVWAELEHFSPSVGQTGR